MKKINVLLFTSALLINATMSQAQEASSAPCSPYYGEEVVAGVSGKYVNRAAQSGEGTTLVRVPVTKENFDKEQATSEALSDASRQFRKISQDQQHADGVVVIGKPRQTIDSDPSRNQLNLTLGETLAAATSPSVAAMLSFTKRSSISAWYPRMIVPVMHYKGYATYEAYMAYRCESAKQCSSNTLTAMSTVPTKNFQEETDRQQRLNRSNGFAAEFCR